MLPPTVLDLFCGAGGLGYGFQQSGFKVVQAVDHDEFAVATYALALGKHVSQSEISSTVELPKSDVIIGGPPCQGFSSAGRRRLGDPRNSLVSEYAKLIARLRPSAFVFENVEGFLTAEGGSRVIELLQPLLQAGYRIHLRKINAANYGVPQHRKRVLAIGGLGWDPTFPSATHSASGAPGAHRAGRGLPHTPTLSEAFAGLPSPADSSPGVPQGHYLTQLKGADLERAKALQPGQTMRDLPDALRHESYQRRAFRRVMDGTPSERRGGAPAGIRRLRGDEPSKAITGGARGEFLHPSEDRALTTRECARLQTFPDDFEFVGKTSTQLRLIGNAVPPRLATCVARQLHHDLMDIRARLQKARRAEPDGALLSFIPTLAEGVSPALRHTVELVQRTFGWALANKELSLWDTAASG